MMLGEGPGPDRDLLGARPAGTPPVVHPPKVETFDVRTRTNTDPKGIVRPVTEYRRTPGGLYMYREADHPRFHAVESWLLPDHDLRITDFHFRPGCEMEQEFYVDVMTIDAPAGGAWTTRDLYLDVVCRTGSFTEVLDADELAKATARGILDVATSTRALEVAFRASTGIAAHGHDLREWARSEGLDLSWRRR